MKNGLDLIIAERDRQLSVFRFTEEHDDRYQLGELGKAGVAYEEAARYEIENKRTYQGTPPASWPWDPAWFHPKGGAVRMLTKAGALYMADERRWCRANPDQQPEGQDVRVLRCAVMIDDLYTKLIGPHLVGERALVTLGVNTPIKDVRIKGISPENSYVHLLEIKEKKERELGWFSVNRVALLEVLGEEVAA